MADVTADGFCPVNEARMAAISGVICGCEDSVVFCALAGQDSVFKCTEGLLCLDSGSAGLAEG